MTDKTKKIVIGVVVFVVLAGIGFSIWFWGFRDTKTVESSSQETSQVQNKDNKDEKKDAKKDEKKDNKKK